MVRLLLRLRWLAVVVALFGALNAIAFIAIGAVRAFEAYRMIALGPPWTGEHAPGVVLARSVDAFLLAMVFLVFAIGVMTLFLSRDTGHGFENIPEWMRVKSLSELKFVIWEAILAAVVVASVEGLVAGGHELTWNALVTPVAVFVLAAGLFLARRAH